MLEVSKYSLILFLNLTKEEMFLMSCGNEFQSEVILFLDSLDPAAELVVVLWRSEDVRVQ